MGLRVEDHIHGFLWVRRSINENVADTSTGFDDRHRSIFNHSTNQTGPTTWDQYIDSPTIGHECICPAATKLLASLDLLSGHSQVYMGLAQYPIDITVCIE